MKHVFGPVPSRRLGLSLGIDIIVPKTCTMDCVYCELGPTTNRTVERVCFVDVDEVMRELEDRLRESPAIDFVTFSGSGEPTLNADFRRAVAAVRSLTDAPVAVLTNGSLVTDPDVRAGFEMADVVAPSVDAVSREVFEAVNRPDPALDPDEIIDALASFGRGFRGQLWLETVLVEGLNDDSGEVRRIRQAIDRIAPDRVHVNTVVRPPSDPSAKPLSRAALRHAAARLGPLAEVIAPTAVKGAPPVGEEGDLIVAMAERRPVTVSDVARALGSSQAHAAKILGRLLDEKRISVVQHEEKQYYRA